MTDEARANASSDDSADKRIRMKGGVVRKAQLDERTGRDK